MDDGGFNVGQGQQIIVFYTTSILVLGPAKRPIRCVLRVKQSDRKTDPGTSI